MIRKLQLDHFRIVQFKTRMSRWRWGGAFLITMATAAHLIRHAFPTAHFFPTHLLSPAPELFLPTSTQQKFSSLTNFAAPLLRTGVLESRWGRGMLCIIVLHSSLLLKFSPPFRFCDS
ncbi:hypothetical protein CDAR_263181 [Caerostris darwini]|uniref:Uncharacterized protein n=1 Tax=Caerostris darwini TaxID=1538125 RepID=A0AAV4RYS3_9ARAC|nr:hypothetical protein CDAR_263181 [Caerostris darwini]